MGDAKPWYQSKTIWVNLTALAVWILTLVASAAQGGDLPEQLAPYAVMITLVANLLLRLVTTQPVTPPMISRKLPSILFLVLCPTILSAAPPIPVLRVIVNDESYELPDHDAPIRVIAGDKVVYDLSSSEGADRYFVMLDNHRPGQKEISTRDKWQRTEQRTRAGEYQLRFIVSNDEATVELKRVVQVLCKEPALPDEPDPPAPQPIPPKPIPPPTPIPPPSPPPIPPGEFLISDKVATIVGRINSPQRSKEAGQLADSAEALAAQIAAGTVTNVTDVLMRIGTGIKALNSPAWTAAAAEFSAVLETTWKAHSSGRLKVSVVGGLQDPTSWATLLREIAIGVRSVR